VEVANGRGTGEAFDFDRYFFVSFVGGDEAICGDVYFDCNTFPF
jgi:hypothetical protein